MGCARRGKRLHRRPVQGKSITVIRLFAVLCGLAASALLAEDEIGTPAPVEIVISVKDQRLALLHEGGVVKRFPISTSKFGLGDSFGSYKTPLGRMRVCDKIGDGLALGAVMKHRNATGEILPVNAPGRDPIVTRILWLEGLEARNGNARSRGIYIHGTVEEDRVGDPVSYGCIRMRSRDVVELFASAPVGTPVSIIEEKLPRFRKPAPPKSEVIIVKQDPAPAPAPAERSVPGRLSLAAAPRPAEKPAEPSGPALFGDHSARAVASRKSPGEKSESRPAKVSAGAVLLAEGREVSAEGTESSNRRIEVSMRKSILFAGLPEIAAAPAREKAEPASKAGPRVR